MENVVVSCDVSDTLWRGWARWARTALSPHRRRCFWFECLCVETARALYLYVISLWPTHTDHMKTSGSDALDTALSLCGSSVKAKKVEVYHRWRFCTPWLTYLLLLVSLMLCPGIRTLPFFSQMRWGSGTPCATQVNTALPPAGLDTDCGHCRNSGGAEVEQTEVRPRADSKTESQRKPEAHPVHCMNAHRTAEEHLPGWRAFKDHSASLQSGSYFISLNAPHRKMLQKHTKPKGSVRGEMLAWRKPKHVKDGLRHPLEKRTVLWRFRYHPVPVCGGGACLTCPVILNKLYQPPAQLYWQIYCLLIVFHALATCVVSRSLLLTANLMYVH